MRGREVLCNKPAGISGGGSIFDYSNDHIVFTLFSSRGLDGCL